MQEPQKDTLLSWEQNFHRGPRYWLRETPDGVVTRSMVWIGVVLAVCGAALFVYAATHVPPNSRAPWVPQIVGGGFVVAGVLWVIGIRFRNVPTLIVLFLFFNQQRARAKLLYLVQKMEIPAIDQSQG